MENKILILEDRRHNQSSNIVLKDERRSTHNIDLANDLFNNIKHINVNNIGFIDGSTSKWSICAFVTFIIVSIIISVLVIYFTTPKSHILCHVTMKQATKNDIINNSRPFAVAVGHLNDDMWIDIAVANSGMDRIGVFLNNGNGSFVMSMMYSTGIYSRPLSLIVADVNGDNWMDIIAANYDSHTIGVLFGQGNGTFSDPIETFLGQSRPVSIAVGDLNNDKWLDIVVANNGTQSISVLIGNNQGLFQLQMIYSTGYDSFPSAIAIVDLNNDNLLDVAITNYGTNNILIFLGDGTGSLIVKASFPTNLGSNPYAITVADVNNDDQKDIIVANYHGDNVGIFFGYGNGMFSTQRTYFLGVGFNPSSVATGYIDNDQQLDIVVSNTGSHSISVLIGYVNGTFATPATYPIAIESTPIGLTVGDFDSNNQSDVVMANFHANNIIVLTQYSSISSKTPTTYLLDKNSRPQNILIVDLNNDNNSDIIVSNYATDTVGVFLGYGNGSFQEEIKLNTGDGARPNHVAIADFNNDNFLDMVVANYFANHISLLLGYGNGSFNIIKGFSFEQILTITSVGTGHFDDDENVDIVAADLGFNQIMIFLGYGNGSFKYVQSYTNDDGARPTFVAVADFNNDQYLDIATANLGTSKVGIFLGYGNGSFSNQMTLSTGTGSMPYRVIVGDVNNDTCSDIVAINGGSNNVVLILGYCNGSFAEYTICYGTPQSTPKSVSITDANDDQWLDIVIANADFDNIEILFGYGNGSFSSQTTFSSGINSGPYAIGTGDLNNDNRVDVVVGNQGTSSIAILLGHPNTGINNTAEFLLGDYYFDFLTRTYYSTGSSSHPYSIAVGDFNRDTHLDIVVTNSGTDTIGILLGDDSGFFPVETTYLLDINSRPQSVIIADFNKDHYLDIAVANFLGDNVVIFQGHGNGSFIKQSIVSIASGSNPNSLAIGDFNNDGWLDLVSTNEGKNTINLMFGYRYTSFQKSIRSTTGTISDVIFVVVADFNNDGLLDVATANYNLNNVAILLGYGNGSFAPPMMYGYIEGSHPWGIAIDDFNNDNKVDIAICAWGRNRIGIILGNGDGTFEEPLLYFVGHGTRPAAIITGDFNNDNYADVATANYGDSSVSLFLGYGNGTFGEVRVLSTGDNSSPASVTIGDLDKDHFVDIIVSNEGSYSVGVLYGKGDGTFENVTIYLVKPNSSPQYALSGDLNNDTLPDIAVTLWGSGEIGIFLGYGNRTFSPVKYYSNGYDLGAQNLQFGDFNDDQYVDIVVCTTDFDKIGVLFGNGDGTFKDIVLYDTGRDASTFSLAVADFNNDDIVDVIFTDNTADEVGVLFRNGYQYFGGYISLPYVNNSKSSSITVEDLNNDTYLDIIITNSGIDNVGILFGHGDGTFTDVQMYSTGNNSQPISTAVGDFNRDTFLDIVVANSNTNNIGILLGSSYGTFNHSLIFSTGIASHPVSTTVGDFNNDGILDVVVANAGTSNVAILTGFGNGSFADPVFYPMSYNSQPNRIVFGDFNDDHSVDIAVVNYGADNIKIIFSCPSISTPNS